MSIVIITIPGESRRTFANALYKKTSGKVELVVIQKPKPRNNSFLGGVMRLYKNVGLLSLPREIWYATLLRLDKSIANALEYFREQTKSNSLEDGYLAKTIETESVNSSEVLEALKKISPSLLVIWGNTILKPEILSTAKRAINLHMGLCPYYRGVVANQGAVMAGDLEKIGATIHYALAEVDAGDIITTIRADTSKSPRELFRDLNDRAEKLYLDTAYRLLLGETLPKNPQDVSIGKNFMLKGWLPSKRYKLAKRLSRWEKSGKFD